VADPPLHSAELVFPLHPQHNHAPGIVGTHSSWAAWVQRWHDTSTLTPKVRAIVRTLMAKAGRWLAAEHPEITEPGQWTRQTCAAWVAAVDRMRVGDYVQRHDGLGARAGAPIWREVREARLTMRNLSDAFIDEYLAAAGAAVLSSVGAYQIEGLGAQLFSRIDGDHFTILGLPLLPLLDMLRTQGILKS
jgi:hypothetical protein